MASPHSEGSVGLHQVAGDGELGADDVDHGHNCGAATSGDSDGNEGPAVNSLPARECPEKIILTRWDLIQS